MKALRAVAGVLTALALSGASAQPAPLPRPIEINQARLAELEQLRGVGPELGERIVTLRQQRPFRDWPDLVARLAGLGPRSAAQWSDQGLRVNGEPWRASAASPLTP